MTLKPGFNTIVSIASNTEDARSSAMFLGPTTEFGAMLANKMVNVNRKANLLACYLRTFLYIFFSASAVSKPNFSPVAIQMFILINL